MLKPDPFLLCSVTKVHKGISLSYVTTLLKLELKLLNYMLLFYNLIKYIYISKEF